jgi:hypothetical protein
VYEEPLNDIEVFELNPPPPPRTATAELQHIAEAVRDDGNEYHVLDCYISPDDEDEPTTAPYRVVQYEFRPQCFRLTVRGELPELRRAVAERFGPNVRWPEGTP